MTFFTDFPDPPVDPSLAQPYEAEFLDPNNNGSLAVQGASTNGLIEYTASNFNNELKGDLLAAAFNDVILRFQLDGTGTQSLNKSTLVSAGNNPLDLTSQGDNDVFPGTIWVAVHGGNQIKVFEPGDYDGTAGVCTGADDPNLDEDNDGFSNADEIDNGTDPCSQGIFPPDYDGDLISNLNDPDDDNDGLLDTYDPFPVDPLNGMATSLNVLYGFSINNNEQIPGTLFGLGFTGLMTNGDFTTATPGNDYQDFYDENDLNLGGAASKLGIENIPAGSSLAGTNDQWNGFQFGLNVDSTSVPFSIHTEVESPYFLVNGNPISPIDGQFMGMYMGTGDQDNYLRLALNAQGGAGGVEVVLEVNGSVVSSTDYSTAVVGDILNSLGTDLYFSVNPATQMVQPQVSLNGGATIVNLGAPIAVPANWFSDTDNFGLAIGVISSSGSTNTPFDATWDFINVVTEQPYISQTLADINTAVSSPAETLDLEQYFNDNGGVANLTFSIEANSDTSIGASLAGSDLTITYPDTAAVSDITIRATDQGSLFVEQTFTVTVAEIPTVLYRINAGGTLQTSLDLPNPDWDADTGNGATTYRNGPSNTAGSTITNRDASVPVEAPQDIFSTERWDPASGDEMKWFFSLPDPATYEVRLYFANSSNGTSQVGERVFNVELEGSPVLVNYDIVADVGHQVGTMKSFLVTVTDGTLNLDFYRVTENPLINGIEILGSSSGPTPGFLTASPASIHYFSQETGTTSNPETIVFNNTGGTALTISDIAFTGQDAAEFSHNGNTPIVIAPGGSDSVAVNFVPLSSGSKSAIIAFTHDGDNGSPLSVSLTAEAIDPSPVPTSTDMPDIALVQGSPNDSIDLYTYFDDDQGQDSLTFTVQSNTGSFVGASVDSNLLVLTYPAAETDTALITIRATDPNGNFTAESFTVEVSAPIQILYRINAGGPVVNALDAPSPEWEVDDLKNVTTQYHNSTRTSTHNSTSGRDATVPVEVPQDIYFTERWDHSSGDEMKWFFSLPDSGNYEIRLYFANGYNGTSEPGERVFDVVLEGDTILAAYDIVADVGHRIGTMKTFELEVNDGTLNLDFYRIVGDPIINGIEILPGEDPSVPIALTPIVDQNNIDGDTVSLQVVASGGDGALVYTATNLPSGLSIDAGTGLISGGIDSLASASSPVTVSIEVDDADGDNADKQSITFEWNIAPIPVAIVLDSIPDQSDFEEDAISLALVASGGNSTLNFSATGLPASLVIDPLTGLISGVIDSALSVGSPFLVTVSVDDSDNDTSDVVTRSFNWEVKSRVILLDPIADQQDAEGDSISLTVIASGGDTSLVYQATGLPLGLSIDSLTGVISGNVALSAAINSPYAVAVTVDDIDNDPADSKTSNFVWTITALPVPIVLDSIPDQMDFSEDNISLALIASGGNNSLQFSATGLPIGLTIDSTTGVIGGVIDSIAHLTSPYTVTVNVDDNDPDFTDIQTRIFTWVVKTRIISLDSIADQFHSEGASVQLTAQASGGDSTLVYSALNLPAGISIDSVSGEISGIVTSGASALSPYTVTVSVDDSDLDNTDIKNRTFIWNINEGIPISTTPIVEQCNAEGDTVNLAVISTGGDAQLSYTANNLPAGISIDTAGVIRGTLTSASTVGSPFSVSIYIDDADGDLSDIDTVNFVWNVYGAPEVLYRLNTGGPQISAIDGGIAWGGDTKGSPSVYLINQASNNTTTHSGMNSYDPAVDLTTTATGIYNSERWDPSSGSQIEYEFPVSAGVYELRLYLGNESGGTSLPGSRVFDISVEGAIPALLKDIDLSDQFGHRVGGVYTYSLIVNDGGLNIQLINNISNPMINGIEIITGDSCNLPSAYPITFNSFPDQYNEEGVSINLALSASGGFGALSYTATGLPAGLSLDPQSGIISGVIAASAAANSPYAVTLEVDDADTVDINTETRSFVWEVFPAGTPVIDAWTLLEPQIDPTHIPRHENSFVKAGNKFYLFGGRESPKQVEIYDYIDRTWSQGTAQAPVEINHFQPVEYAGYIWVIGAFETNSFPTEEPADSIYLYDPVEDTWETGPVIPEGRRRGAGGMVEYQGKFYLVGGNTIGHDGGYVSWFDEFDPTTGTWTELTDAPRARDHFQAVLIGDKLYLAGGRLSGGVAAGTLIEEIDVYDFTTSTWSSLAPTSNLPTLRAGTAAVNFNGELVVIGGEGNGQAWPAVEAMDVNSNTWKNLSPLNLARHGTQAVVAGDGIYITSGSPVQGSGNMTNMEVYSKENAPAEAPFTIAQLSSNVTSIDIAPVAAGDTATASVKIYNTGGTQGILISEINFQSPQPYYSLIDTLSFPFILPAGDSAEVELRYTPTAVDSIQGSMVFTHNGSNGDLLIPFIDPSVPILLSSTADQVNTAADTVNLQIVASGGDSTLVYSAIGLPAGLAIDSVSGMISGVIDSTADLGSPYLVTINVDDSDPYSADIESSSFTWEVIGLPIPIVIDTPLDQISSEGDTISLDIIANGGNAALTYTASGLPLGLSINPTTGQITGIIDGLASNGSPYLITITVDDADADTTDIESISFNWTVNFSPVPIVVNNIPDQNHSEGSFVNVAISASGGNGAFAYTAQGLPAGLSINPTTGQITGTVASSASNGSPYAVTITVDDADADSTDKVSTNFSWFIDNSPLPITLSPIADQVHTEGDIVSVFAVASGGNATLVYSASGLPPGLSLDAFTGEMSGTIDSAAFINSPYFVTITVDDSDADITDIETTSFTWTVNEFVAPPIPILIDPIADQNNVEGQALSLSLSASGGDGALVYTAVGLPLGLNINTFSGIISGVVDAAASNGSPYAVTITVDDSDADNTDIVTANFNWTIAPSGGLTGPNWTRMTDAKHERWLVDGILLDDQMYTLSGFRHVAGKDEIIAPFFERYDIPNDTWTDLTPMPVSKYETDTLEAGVTHTTNVLVNDTIWAIGGRTGNHPGPVTEEVWLYDIPADNWFAGPSLPVELSGGGCVLVGRTLHYVGGFFNACSGMSENHFTLNIDEWLANPATVTWSNWRKPNPRLRAHVSVVHLAGKIYEFGGEFGHDCCPGGPVCRLDLAHADVYDIETDTWTILPDLPYPRSHSELNSFPMDAKIYQVGSEVNETTSKTTLVYDPANGLWSEEPTWEFDELIMAPAVVVYKDSLIVTHGGYPGRGDPKPYAMYTSITRTPDYALGWGRDTLDFTVYQGKTEMQKALVWTISGSLRAGFSTNATPSWISMPDSLDLDLTAKRLPVTVNSAGLASGTYYANIVVSGEGPDVVNPSTSVNFAPDTIVVKMTVGPDPDGIVLMEQPDVCEDIEVGMTHLIPVDISTPGATAITLTGSAFSNSTHFALNGALPSGLTPNGTEQFFVEFTPDSVGPFSSTLTVSHSGTSASTDVLLGCTAIPACVVPADWIDTTLGTPALAGSSCVTGNTYRMSGAGTDIGGTNDQGRILATRVSGDGDMIIKVNSITEQNGDTKIGIMLRESLDDNSANAYLFINPENKLGLQWRETAGQTTSKATVLGYYPPHWLKLERSGNSFTAYHSEDGLIWSLVNGTTNPVTLNLSDTLYAAIAMTSHNAAALSDAVVENVSVNFNRISPIITSPIADQFNMEGDNISLQVAASGGDGTLTYSATGLPASLTINPNTGEISGVVANSAVSPNPYLVRISVDDADSDTADVKQIVFNWSIQEDIPIVLNAFADQINLEGDNVSLATVVSGGNGNLVFSASGLPGGLSIDPNTGEINGTIAGNAAANSPYAVTITVDDSDADATDTESTLFNWTVNPQSVPIDVIALQDQQDAEADQVNLQVVASGGNGLLVYAALGLPPGLSINASTGEISGIVSANASNGSPYLVTITVDDSDADFNDQITTTFTWIIDPQGSPLTDIWLEAECGIVGANWTPMTDVAASEGTYLAAPAVDFLGAPSTDSANSISFVFDVATAGQYEVFARLIALNGNSDSYWVRANGGNWIKWNQIAKSTSFIWDQVHDNNSGNALVSFNLNAGTNTLDISIREKGSSLDKVFVSLSNGTPSGFGDPADNCIDPSIPIAATVIPTQNNDEGETVNVQVVASGGDSTLTYAATGLPGTLNINPTTGLISGTIDNNAATGSPYAVAVTIDDSDADFADQVTLNFDWLVDTATVPVIPIVLTNPQDQLNTELDVVNVQVVASGGNGNLIYVAGGLPPGLYIDANTGLISGAVDTLAANNSPYLVTITIDDADTDNTDIVSSNFTWTIDPFIVTPIPIVVNAIANQTNTEEDTVSLFVAASGGNGNLVYSATGLPVGLSINAITGEISGVVDSLAFANNPYAVEITVDDSDADATDKVTTNFIWTINQLPRPISLTTLVNRTDQETDVISLQIVANGGNGALVYSASILPSGLSLNPSTGLITGTIDTTAANGSPYNVIITVDDTDADTTDRVTDDFVWKVAELPIAIVLTPTADQVNEDADTVNVNILASGGNGPLEYSATGLPPGLVINPTTGLIDGVVDSTASNTSPYLVIITLDDSDGDTTDVVSDTLNWTINEFVPAPIAIVIDSVINQNNFELDTVSLQVIASGGNNALTYSATGLPAGLSINPTTGEISGVVADSAANGSPYAVVISVDDSDVDTADVVSVNFTWTIEPVTAIVVDAIADQSNFEEDTVSLQLVASGGDAALTYTASGLPFGLTLNPSTGEISGVVADSAANGSPYVVLITVDDADSDSTDTESISFTWTIAPTTPILVDVILDQTNTEKDTLSLNVVASGGDAALTYTATGLPSGLTINPTTGEISGVVADTASNGSPYVVLVSVDDTDADTSDVVTVTFTWTIDEYVPPAIAIVVDAVADQINFEADTVSLNVIASGGNNALSFSATGLPAGLSINPTTGEISGVIDDNAANGSPYAVVISVDDSDADTADVVSINFTWTIAPVTPILINAISDQTNIENDTVSLNVIASGGDNTLSYSATGLPLGLAIDPVTGEIAGVIDSTASLSSTYTVSITVDDSDTDLTDAETISFTWTVLEFVPGAIPIVVNGILDQTNIEKDTVSLNILASGGDNALTFSATGLPFGLTIDPASGEISGVVADTASNGSPYSVVVSVDDSDADTADVVTVAFTWTIDEYVPPAIAIVVDAVVDQSNFEADTVSVNVIASGGNNALTYTATGLPLGLTINPTTGEISGVIDDNAANGSPYAVVISVDDSDADTADVVSISFTWTIEPVTAIIVDIIADQSNFEEDTVSLNVVASGGDAALTYTASGLPSGLTLNLNTGEISGVIADSAANGSPYSVVITVDDVDSDNSDSETISFTWTIEPVTAIIVNAIADQNNLEGDTVSVNVVASGGDATLTYAATGLPLGLTINPTTGEISGVIDDNAANGSPYAVVISVDDSDADTADVVSISFTWTIEPVTAIIVDIIADQSNFEEDTVSLNVVASGGDAALTYTASGLPSGLTLNLNTGEISGVIADSAANGSPYSVVITVDDADSDNSDSETISFTWTIEPVTAIIVNAIADQNNLEGDTVSVNVVASGGDATLTYAATGLPLGLTINPTTGEISGVIDDNAANGSPYAVVISVDDSDADTADVVSISFTWTIEPVTAIIVDIIADQSNFEEDTLSINVIASGGDAALTYTATGLPSGLTINATTGEISGVVADSAANGSPYVVVITVDDADSDTTDSETISFTWTIEPVTAIIVNAIADQNNLEGDTVSVNVVASGGDATLAYAATGLPLGLTINPTTGEISGVIDDNAANGSPYAVVITVDDTDGDNSDSETISFTWTIDPVTPILVNAIADQTNSEKDTVSLNVVASGGDGAFVYSATGLPLGLAINPTTGEISGVIDDNASNGSPYAIVVSVDDSDSDLTDIVTIAFTWTIEEYVPPVIAIVVNGISDQTNAEKDTVSLNVVASGGNNALTYTATGLPLGLTINPTTGEISGVVDDNASNGSPYAVVVRVDDSDADTTDVVTVAFTWTIDEYVPPVTPIVITPIADQADTEEDVISLLVTATGGDAALSYTASGLPAGLTLNPTSGEISGTIASTASNGSPYVVIITVDDADVDTTDKVTTNFTWTIDPLPVTITDVWLEAECAVVGANWTEQSDVNASGGLYLQSPGTNSNTNPSTNPDNHVVFTFNVTDAGQYKIFGRSIAPNTNDDSFWVRANGGTWVRWNKIQPSTNWTWDQVHEDRNNNQPVLFDLVAGSNTLEFAGRENGSVLDKIFVTLTGNTPVGTGGSSANCIGGTPITITPVSDQTNFEGETVNFPIVASGGDGALTYVATGLPTGLTINSTSGVISGIIDPVAVSQSPFSVSIRVDDTDTTSLDEQILVFNWTVLDSSASSTDIWLEMECGVIGSNWTEVADANASNGFYMLSPPTNANTSPTGSVNDIISFSVNIGVPGQYKIFGRVLAPTTVDDSYWVRVNGGTWVRWNQVQPSNSFVWDQVHEDRGGISPVLFDMVLGTNTVEIAGRENGSIIDKLFITLNGTTPSGLGGASTNCIPPSIPISLNPVSDQIHTEGDVVNVQVIATGGDAALSYVATGLPAGLSINASTGLITGTIANTAANGSPYTVSITVDDADADTTDKVNTSFNWTVHPTPIAILLDPISDQTNTEADTVSLPVIASGGNAALVYSASGLPTGLSIDPVTGEIAGVIDSTASNGSTYSVTVSVDDSDVDNTDIASVSFTWTVEVLPIPITVLGIPDQSHLDADTISLPVMASGGNGPLTYSATGLPPGVSLHATTGLISGILDSTASSGSVYVVIISVDDGDADGTDIVSVDFEWVIDPLPIAIVLAPVADQLDTEGDTVSVPVSASGGDGTLVYSATGLPAGLVIDTGTGFITGAIDSTASNGSPYSVTISVDDSDADFGDIVSTNFTWTVEGLPIDIVINALANQTNDEGDTLSLPIGASGGNGALVYTAIGLPAGLSMNPNTGVISGVVDGSASNGSPYTVQIIVDDSDSDNTDQVSASFNWTINSLPVPIVVTPIGDQTNSDGDVVNLSVIASGGNGGLLYTAAGLPLGLFLDISTGVISGTIDSTASSGSAYSVSIFVDDSDADGTDVQIINFIWTVNPLPVAIVVSGIADQTNVEGDTANVPVTASGGDGALVYSASGLPTGLSIDPISGLISGAIDSLGAGLSPYFVTITVDDSDADFADVVSTNFIWFVTELPIAILVDAVSDQTNIETDVVSLPIAASGGNGALVYSASGLPAGLTIDTNTGEISGTIASNAADFSPYVVVVDVDDSDADITDFVSTTFLWTVDPLPIPIVLNPIVDQTSTEGDIVGLPVNASGGDGALVYTATGLPTGLTIDPGTGMISGTIASGAAVNSPFIVGIEVDDSDADVTDVETTSFVWTVNEPSTVSTDVWLEAECGTVGANWSEINDPLASNGVTLLSPSNNSTGSASGSTADWVTYTFDVSTTGQYKIFGRVKTPNTNDDSFWVRVNGGAWVKWNEIQGSSTFIWDQVHDNNNNNTPVLFNLNAGTNTLDISVRENGTYLDKLHITLTGNTPIADGDPAANCPGGIPINLAAIGDQNSTDGDAGISLQVVASGGEGNLTYAATGLPLGLSIDPFTGLISGDIDSTASASSPYNVVITVDDSDGTQIDEKTISFTWFVLPIGSSSSETWLEAECGTVGGNWTEVPDGDASNGFYLQSPGQNFNSNPSTNLANRISFTVQVPVAGQYKVFGRTLAPNTGDDSFWVRVNGSTWARWNQIQPSTSWTWDQVHDDRNGSAPVLFDMVIGNNTIEIAGRENGSKLDKLYVTLAGSTPVGFGDPSSNCGSSLVNQSNNFAPNQNPDPNMGGSSVNQAGSLVFDYQISTYPNPLNKDDKVLFVEFDREVNGAVEYVLSDLHGREIQKEDLEMNNSRRRAKIRLEPLPAGLYMLMIKGEGFMQMKRIKVSGE